MKPVRVRNPLTAGRIGASLAVLAFLQAASPPGIARPPSTVDARHCLDQGDYREIARCAEQYRPGGPGRSARASPAAPPPAAPPAPKAATTAAPAASAAPQAAPPAPAPRRKRPVREVDARHCLDLGTIAAITRCAQQYR